MIEYDFNNSNKFMRNMTCKTNVIFILTIINTICLLMLCGLIMYFFKPINDMSNLISYNKDRVNKSIDQIIRVSNQIENITSIILDFEFFVKNKIVNSLCNNYFTYKIFGKYLCSNSTQIKRFNYDDDICDPDLIEIINLYTNMCNVK